MILNFMKSKVSKINVFLRFWSSTGFSSCPFYKGSGKISFRYLRPRIGNFPFLRRTAVLQAFNKNVHVSDRCTKIALVRKTDCFSIGPDLPNSNADAFHKGMGNIIAKSLENDIGLLHIGYLTIAQIPLSSLGQLYLEYLSKDIDTLEILGTSMEDH